MSFSHELSQICALSIGSGWGHYVAVALAIEDGRGCSTGK